MFDPKNTKKDFPIFSHEPDLVYLDTAATSQTPQVVLERMNEYYTRFRANIHRGLYRHSQTATEAYEQARGDIAAFIGATPQEVVFTAGTTAGMNMLCLGLERLLLQKPGRIVASTMEHHSVLVPLQQLAARTQSAFVPIPLKQTTLDYTEAKKAITSDTRIVAVTLASNVLGTINDVAEIAKTAHAVGALVIVDATAAAGHITIDVNALGADVVLFSGHKMCGPTGIGVLWGTKEILASLSPMFSGGGIVERVRWEETQFQSPPQGLEPGTPHIAGALGLAAAVSYLQSVGVDVISKHVTELFSYALLRLQERTDVAVYTHVRPEENVGIISFVQEGIHPHDTAEILARHNIAVRAGHHCAQPLLEELDTPATVRISFYLYNTREDIKALLEGLDEARDILGK